MVKRVSRSSLYKMWPLGRHMAGRWVLLLFLPTLSGHMVAYSRCLGECLYKTVVFGDKACKVTSLLEKGFKALIL